MEISRQASDIEAKLSPSFLTGTDQLLNFDDGDVGFDIDLDAYSVPELRAMLRTSRRLLEQTRLPVSKTFRAGGYLGTPKVLQAIHDEGFTVDSSATDHRQLDELKVEVLPKRIKAIWPGVDTGSQPWLVDAGRHAARDAGRRFADTPPRHDRRHRRGRARSLAEGSEPGRVVVLGFHRDRGDFARASRGNQKVRRPELARSQGLQSVAPAAERARRASRRTK